MDLIDKRITPRGDVLVREIHGESVLLDLASESYFGLDEVGTGMWEALMTASSVHAAYELLLDAYEVQPERLREDLEEFVAELSQAGLLDVHDI